MKLTSIMLFLAGVQPMRGLRVSTPVLKDSATCPPWSHCPETYVDKNQKTVSFSKQFTKAGNLSMLMAVFTAQDHVDRRQAVRDLWKSPQIAIESSNNVVRKFVVCSSGGELKQEAEDNKDIIFLECLEGYKNGALTKKIASLMKYFVENFSEGTILFKTDDDTYVDTPKLLSAIAEQSPEQHLYAGLEYGREYASPVIRDQSNPFYEPLELWDQPNYPISMAGGPGYALSYGLVQDILKQKLPERYPLYNEDKAVGVWVHQVEEKTKVNRVQLSATDGYNMDLCNFAHNTIKGDWNTYPFVLHHHLSPDHLKCFSLSYDVRKPSCFC